MTFKRSQLEVEGFLDYQSKIKYQLNLINRRRISILLSKFSKCLLKQSSVDLLYFMEKYVHSMLNLLQTQFVKSKQIDQETNELSFKTSLFSIIYFFLIYNFISYFNWIRPFYSSKFYFR